VSAHYLVGRDGIIYQLVDERARAWHAGKSQWGSDTDLNSSSLGIELDNNGREPFSEAQIAALLVLLDDIKRRYDIPTSNFLGHSDIAPERKIDPSRYFPWKTLSERGFELWCDSPSVELPTSFATPEALQAFGYDVSNMEAAIRAFKFHFGGDDSSPQLNDDGQRLLYCLLRRKENLQKAE
jgi:N-acetylmuramoyl-L-alanine amidase